jgi:hypothetical protein
MNKFTISFLCLGLTLLFSSCSSVKVLDSWKSDRIPEVKDNNFLIVARANNPQARIAFENEIVRQMKSNGYQATASFAKFENMKLSNPESEASKEALKKVLKQEGFDAVILTVMKDYQEETRLDKQGGYYAGGSFYGYYPRYYGGFYPYFYNPMSFHTPGNYIEESYTVSTSKLYILETTIYNLDETGEKQLVAVITSQIDNPQTASGAAKAYVKEIAKKLKS